MAIGDPLPQRSGQDYFQFSAALASDRTAGKPLVALETAVLSFGLPYPDNVKVFRAMERAVRAGGAVPAPIALGRGRVLIGLDDEDVDRLARGDGTVKCGRREIGMVLSSGQYGATTVSSTLWLAHRAGLVVFATGGTGGVHPGHSGELDVSADLMALATIPMIIVSAGVKSICDVGMTAELLETLSVPVLGFQTDRFPHFYGGDSSTLIPRANTTVEVVRAFLAHRALGGEATVFVANPAPQEHRLEPNYLNDLTSKAMAEATHQGIRGNAVTPFLLSFLAKASGGRTVVANEALLLNNAELAGRISVDLAKESTNP